MPHSFARVASRSHPVPRSRMRAASGLAIAAAVVASLIAGAPAGAAELPPAADGAWRFDFGTATSPVADGHRQVLATSAYTAETGWGVTTAAGVTLFDRNRTGSRTPADPLAEDFVAGTDWGFLLDGVPEGEYDVTVTIGDALPAASGTNATVSLEGVAQTRMTTARGGTTTSTFRTTVADGQLTAGFTGTGLGAYLNGLVVTPVVPAVPAGLTATRVAWNGVDLAWTASDGAASYRVLRAEVTGDEIGDLVEIGAPTAPAFRDTTVIAGSSYAYAVVAVSTYDRASEPSAEILSGAVPEYVEPEPTAPPAPLPDGDVVVFDFGPGAVAPGALGVVSSTAFGDDWGYGFSTAPTAATPDVDRGGDDAVRGDFVAASGGTFEVDLGAGDYVVSLVAGDRTAASDISIVAEAITKVQPTTRAAGEHLEMSFPIALVDGRLTLQITGTAAALNAVTITRQPARASGSLTTAYLTGDSTVQTYDAAFAPQAGWGQMIGRFLAPEVVVANHAIGGRSSKNFISQGRLDDVLRVIRPGDYLFVQFGHNDATQGVDDRYASPADYKEYLRTYVDGARQRGATPVLVTPVSRRAFDQATGLFHVSFPEYVAKMTELAVEEGVALVDLSASSRAYLDEIGPEAAKAVFLHVDPGVFPGRPAGTIDDTHFQDYGAIQMARLVAEGVATLDTPLADDVVDVAPPAQAPVAPTGLVAGSISNAGAQLKWDASPSADIYKVYRQAVADPEQTWALVTYTTQTSVIVQGLAEGASYRYRVVATNGRGDSTASAAVTFTTKQARWRFDFQLAGNPVAPGYTEVTPDTGYTAARGFGFETPLAANAGRDRGDAGGATALQRDFVLPGDSSTFVLDVPNGTYSVKTYSGDWIGSTRTNFDLEGRSFGSGNAGAGAVNESVRGPVLVTDGQLTVRVHGAAAGTRLNGIEVTPILLGPVGLEVVDVDADPSAPRVALAWDAESGATYRVYRQSEFEAAASFVGTAASPEFSDTTARLGLDYRYHVTAVDQTGLESVPSASVDVSFVDPEVDAPAASTGLAVAALDKREIALEWQSPDDALYALVFRSEVEGERGDLVGFAETASFADTDVLTTIPYFYTVVAVNAGGAGEASDQLETPAPTVLQRQAEYLDRAPHAMRTADGVLVTWRMLGTDPDDVAFHVYRDGTRITDAPITDSTNLLDEDGSDDARYFVTKVLDGVETTETEEIGVQTSDHLSIPLQKPADGYTKDGQPYTYSANDVSVGDVDGDGQYEFIVKWDPSNAKDNSQGGYTGNVFVDAYRLDGSRLWRIDLGVNIRAGAHYTQFQVYDLDGDGRAEVTMKTADGTVDGAGAPIGNPSVDHRNSGGYVLQGPEFITVFDGLTGGAIDTIDYTPPRGDVGAWGDAYGNRVDRFLAGTAYLDGETPSVVFSRGYYTRAVVAAYDFDGSELTERWVLDTDLADEELYGQGNHNLSVADVDGDAKDEIVFGSATIDDDGTLLYSTGLGHGDALHVSDLIPSRPGLEVFAAHEDIASSGGRGATMRDARTGEILWGIPATRDTGRAAAGDIDPRHPGAEGWAIGGDSAWNSPVGQLRSASGELIAESIPAANFLAWFDGDLLREIVDHSWDATTSQGTPTIGKWNWETETTDPILRAEGARSNNGTKGTPNIQADLFGDWREEIAWRSADSSELRIYSTTAETEHRIRTLMHDPVYRLGVAWQNTSYNQPPHTSFFLGDGMAEPPAPRIAVTGAPDGTPDTTAPVLAGVPADGTALYEHRPLTLAITATDAESGVRTLDVALDGEPVSPTGTIDLAGLSGERVLTVRAINHAGLVAEETVRLRVSVDRTRPSASLVAPTTSGPVRALEVRVDAADAGGLKRIVANVYNGQTLVKSSQTVVDGADSATHTAAITLPDGAYTIRYNATDLAGNVSVTGSFAVTAAGTAPSATVKDGSSFTVANGGGYDLVSFKLHDAGKVDRVVLNGVVKNLTDSTWSDLNHVRPGVFGAVRGANTLVVHDVAGNTRTVTFTLN